VQTAKKKQKRLKLVDVSYLPLSFGAVTTVVVMYFAFYQTQNILKERLRERITAIVSTASLQFSGEEIAKVIEEESIVAKQIGPFYEYMINKFDIKDANNFVRESGLFSKPIYAVAEKMKKIRNANNSIRYIYILRPTDQENLARFVTDADTIVPVDWDSNGKIDDLEIPPLPGEDYDISEIPAVRIALEKPSAMDDLYSDRWGTFLSGYAPIADANGNTVAVLGIDVIVDDFYKLIRATLVPFAVSAVVLLVILAIQTMALVKIWKNRVELVKELDRQKDELLSIITHQLATPATAIRWQMESLLDGDAGKISKEQKEVVETAHMVTKKLVDLITMILDVSRIQLGKMKVEKQELDINAFFKELVAVVEPKAMEKKVKFIKHIPTNLPVAMLDKRLTNMTIENLLSNAVKYTPEGGEVEFTVALKNNRLYCTVRDTGYGIPEKEQAHAFDKLFRASNVRNKVDGNGFGLYVAKGAVEGQGGSIRFESAEGKGTTFYVELSIK
jgi:signal transduction histidine kinase